MKKIWGILLFVTLGIFLGIALSQIYNNYSNNSELQQYKQSQCYTSLQPSQYFRSQSYLWQSNDYPVQVKDSQLIINNPNNLIKTKDVSETGSMRPTIPDDGILLVDSNKKDIKVGDIITFNCANEGIVHRVIDITNGIYTTKGDNNAVNDTEGAGCHTTINEIEGKVVGVLY